MPGLSSSGFSLVTHLPTLAPLSSQAALLILLAAATGAGLIATDLPGGPWRRCRAPTGALHEVAPLFALHHLRREDALHLFPLLRSEFPAQFLDGRLKLDEP